MNKKIKIILGILIIILAIAILVMVGTLLKKSKIIPNNEPGTIGNTAGNLYNNGLFCEYNGTVFFSNIYDNGNLYAMDPGQTNLRRITLGNISYINAAGSNLYYYATSTGNQSGLGYMRNAHGIYRCDFNGKNNLMLAGALSDGVLLVDSDIYYTSFSENENLGNADVTVRRIDINGLKDDPLFVEHIVLGSVYAEQIYYAGVTLDHNLHTFNTLQYISEEALDIPMYLPIISGSYIYYLDLRDDYHLKAYSMSDGSVQTIVNERIDTYNVYNNIIYYQNVNPDSYALKRIYTDGTGEEIVRVGVFKNINITSEYTYFEPFGDSIQILMTPTYGTVNVSDFDAARIAAFENQ